MGKKKKREEEVPAGAPEWIVTFSDMISLLVTFFVMLMSFSTMEEKEEMVVTAAFSNANRGAVRNLKGHSAQEPPKDDWMQATHPLRGALKPHVRPSEELEENVEEMGQKATDEHVELDFSQSLDGLQISFGREASFAPGSVVVTPHLRQSLVELGRVLENYAHMVVVEGFTDSEFRRTPEFATPEALSSARAGAAAEIMVGASNLGTDVVQIAGLGTMRPRKPNDTAINRTANRRVEVRILSLSKARAQKLESRRARRGK